jgi:hypothetical protein
VVTCGKAKTNWKHTVVKQRKLRNTIKAKNTDETID